MGALRSRLLARDVAPLRAAILGLIEEAGMDGGRFLSREEWRLAGGSPLPDSAVLVLVYEGRLAQALNYPWQSAVSKSLVRDLETAVVRLGFGYERATPWTLVFLDP